MFEQITQPLAPTAASDLTKTQPAGISPALLVDQVRNTVPFIFEPSFLAKHPEPFLRTITQFDLGSIPNPFEYFKLCLSAHHSTVASFVPTDVDNQIRYKLWNDRLSRPYLEEMAELVMQSYHWDSRCVSTRWVTGPKTGEVLAGHSGEWFSTAAAAYSAFRNKKPELAQKIADLILFEVDKESRIYTQLKQAKDGVGALKAATLIAHNLGDLDRVLDQWNVPDEDELKKSVYKLGHNGNSPLAEAGEQNKKYMAAENHRHFCLRPLKMLRRSSSLLLPIGPFFDDWGKAVCQYPGICPDEKGEVVVALVQGWQKLDTSVGYARALCGLLSAFPGGFAKLERTIPAKTARLLKEGQLRILLSVDQRRFEAQWSSWGQVVKKT